MSKSQILKVANTPFNDIRENEILANISDFTVYRDQYDKVKAFQLLQFLNVVYGESGVKNLVISPLELQICRYNLSSENEPSVCFHIRKESFPQLQIKPNPFSFLFCLI